LFDKIKERSEQIKKDGIASWKKKIDYEEYEKKHFNQQLPQLILVFNSHRRVLKMKGYPPLMKEIAEIIEVGQIDNSKQLFRPIEFIQCFQKYHSIE